jgi:hypothetical protein
LLIDKHQQNQYYYLTESAKNHQISTRNVKF